MINERHAARRRHRGNFVYLFAALLVFAIGFEKNVVLCKVIFILVPLEDTGNLAATGGRFIVFGARAAVGSKAFAVGVITDMAGLNNHHILAVFRMGSVAAGGDNPADTAMIERKSAEMFGNQNYGISLVLIRTEGARRHDLSGFKTQ